MLRKMMWPLLSVSWASRKEKANKCSLFNVAPGPLWTEGSPLPKSAIRQAILHNNPRGKLHRHLMICPCSAIFPRSACQK